jgi:predicted phage replisome organizer
MTDVKWIKIVTDVFDDDKVLLIESLPDADSIIVIWFKLLCLAGKQNNSGVFIMNGKIPYTEGMFSTIFRRKESTVRLALETFLRFGMIEMVDGVITIPNWGKHQSLDQLEHKKQYMKGYMQEYREKQKLLTVENSTDKTCKTNSKTNSKANVRQADKIRLDKNKIRKDKNIGGDSIFSDYCGGDTVLLSALNSFEQMRKDIKKPLSENTKNLCLKKLNSLAVDNATKIKIVEQSVLNSWASFYELPIGKFKSNSVKNVLDWADYS